MLFRLARHQLLIAVVVGCSLLVISGCGSASKPSSAQLAKAAGLRNPSETASSFAKSQLAWAACIRSHGVPNLPDPTFGGGGAQVNLSTPAGMLTSPAFFAAEKACTKLGLVGAGQAAQQPPTAAQAAKAVAVSKCMRAHGVPNWPDPTTHVPTNVNTEGYGVAGAVPNSSLVYLVPKSIDIEAPAVKRAAKACQYSI